MDEEVFNERITPHLAANRERMARSVLEVFLMDDWFMVDERLVMERVYLALRENMNMWLPLAEEQACCKAEQASHKSMVRFALCLRREREIDAEIESFREQRCLRYEQGEAGAGEVPGFDEEEAWMDLDNAQGGKETGDGEW
jgi:hypothetical protein